MRKKRQYKIDIFDVLNNIQIKKREYFSLLDEEQQKDIVPLILMRWLTGTDNKIKIERLNNVLNMVVPGPGVSRNYIKQKDHSTLLFYLLTIGTDGKRERVRWRPQKKIPELTLSVRAISEYLKCSTKHAREYLPILTKEDIVSFGGQLGWQKELISKLKKE